MCTQDVALAGYSMLPGCQVACHNITDMDDVHPCRHGDWQAAVGNQHNRRIVAPVDVPRTKHDCRVDDDHIQPLADGILHFHFREILGIPVTPVLRVQVPGV